jgi:hypothetical protein
MVKKGARAAEVARAVLVVKAEMRLEPTMPATGGLEVLRGLGGLGRRAAKEVKAVREVMVAMFLCGCSASPMDHLASSWIPRKFLSISPEEMVARAGAAAMVARPAKWVPRALEVGAEALTEAILRELREIPD